MSDKKKDLEKLAKKFSPTARKAFYEFLENKREIEKKVEDTALIALVWGPGEQTEHPSIYKLRCDIKENNGLINGYALPY